MFFTVKSMIEEYLAGLMIERIEKFSSEQNLPIEENYEKLSTQAAASLMGEFKLDVDKVIKRRLNIEDL